jgi:hypothetical protein
LDEFHQSTEHSSVQRIIRIAILHSVILREFSNEMEQAIVKFGRTRALDEYFDLLETEIHYLFKIKPAIMM